MERTEVSNAQGCDRAGISALLAAAMILGNVFGARADQLEMINGDHYTGKVLSLNTNTIVWQSEMFGRVTLPREKVATIKLGSGAATNLPPITSAAKAQLPSGSAALTNAAPNTSGALRQLRGQTNLIQQVESQFLKNADPAAKDKFNQLMGGLITGKLSVDDIRAEAKSAADQLRALKKESGDETGLYESYLSILDKFVRETAPAAGAGSTNAAKSKLPDMLEKE
jgi:hypothetical protein